MDKKSQSPDCITTAEAQPYLYYNHNDYLYMLLLFLEDIEPCTTILWQFSSS